MSDCALTWKKGAHRAGLLAGLASGLSLAAGAMSGEVPPTMVSPGALSARFRAPEGMRFEYLRAADARRLRYAHWTTTAPPRAIVVLVTGFSEPIEKYYETLRVLHDAGAELWALDWRGQGGSDRLLSGPASMRGYSEGFDANVGDLARLIETIVKPVAGSRLVLVSHSMGGVIALRYLEEHPGVMAGAIFSAPALAVGAEGGWSRAVEHAFVWAGAHLGFASAYLTSQRDWREATDVADGLSHDAERGSLQKHWFASNPTLRVGGVTFGWMAALYAAADVALEPARLARVTTPVLFGIPLADPVTQPGASLAACAHLPSCRLWRAEGAWHELFVEADRWRTPWMATVVDFIAHP